MEEEEIPGEGGDIQKLLGEGQISKVGVPETILEKILSFEEASKCLNTLGKDESGVRYAYLMISPTDRKLTNIATILNFKHLLFIDVSGNFLTLERLQVLSEMPYVIYIRAQRNVIESAALNSMPYLQVLSLSRNHIAETCDISQPILQCLDLNYNQIYTAQFDTERTEAIKQLEMRGNQMFDISGRFPPMVENLYLAENRITKIVENDLARLTHLKILHLRNNSIRKLNGFAPTLVNLKYLNLRQNKINKVRQFRKLQCLPALETLIMLQNPVSGETKTEELAEDDEDAELDEEERLEDMIRIPILTLLPNLKRINKVPVTREEREETNDSKDERYEEIMMEESSEDEQEPLTTTEYTTDYTTELDETQDTAGGTTSAVGED